MGLTLDINTLWNQTLDRLRLQVDDESLQTWLLPARAHTLIDNTFTPMIITPRGWNFGLASRTARVSRQYVFR